MCTHNQCFEQKQENSQTFSNENCHFYGREKSMYVHGFVFIMCYRFRWYAITCFCMIRYTEVFGE